MRKSTAKIIHKFASIQKDYNHDPKVIKHDRNLRPEEILKLKDPKKDSKLRVKTNQKVIDANLIENHVKELWNNTPAPDRIKMRIMMEEAIKKKEAEDESRVQSEEDAEGSSGESQEVKQEDISN